MPIDDFNKPVDAECLADVEEEIGVLLPLDFKAFHTTHGSGEGFLGEAYLVLWCVDEIDDLNAKYQVDEYAPGILLFGSNGAGEGIGFDTRAEPFAVVAVPFIGMGLDVAKGVAKDFDSFIDKLSKGGTLFS